MDDFFTLICFNTPTVWDGKIFSECFADMVLGFGVNVVTVVMIMVLGITQKRSQGIIRSEPQTTISEKIVLLFVPAVGACLSILDIILLWKRPGYHRVFYSFSELMAWVAICIMDRSIVLLNFSFGIAINMVRIKRLSSKRSFLEDPHLSNDMDIEEGSCCDFGNSCNFGNVMTFKFINPVMNRGVVKQVDYEDLLQLPTDMDPSSCHNILSTCWLAQLSNNGSNPSLFRAICCAYGWPYLCLGLLKVVNDCIGFAGPLLLNSLIQFLQQEDLGGYLLAVSLGLTSIIKSFLDMQYTFHLAKLKLKLRSSIMTLIDQKCLCVNLAERSRFSIGEIQTFMSVDADRTVNLCNSFHDMWSLPLQIGLALYLLYTQVKFVFVSGIAITILLIPVNKWIAKLIASATEKMM